MKKYMKRDLLPKRMERKKLIAPNIKEKREKNDAGSESSDVWPGLPVRVKERDVSPITPDRERRALCFFL